MMKIFFLMIFIGAAIAAIYSVYHLCAMVARSRSASGICSTFMIGLMLLGGTWMLGDRYGDAPIPSQLGQTAQANDSCTPTSSCCPIGKSLFTTVSSTSSVTSSSNDDLSELASDGSDLLASIPQEEVLDPVAERRAPSWLEKSSYKENNIYHSPVASGRFSTREECRDDLQRAIEQKVTDYYLDQLDGAVEVNIQLTDDFIKNHLMEDSYLEQVESKTLGRTMYRTHALLAFDSSVNQELQHLGNQQLGVHRMELLGYGGAGLLALLAVVWTGLVLLPSSKASSTRNSETASNTA